MITVVAVAVIAAFGCGENGSVPDDRIVKALKLEEAQGSRAYAMGGDPFCEVDENLLNDSDEIDVASESDELGLVITDSEGAVGVEAVPSERIPDSTIRVEAGTPDEICWLAEAATGERATSRADGYKERMKGGAQRFRATRRTGYGRSNAEGIGSHGAGPSARSAGRHRVPAGGAHRSSGDARR